jgi:hypothetical protein
MNTKVRNIGLRFLQEVDDHLKENIHILSCDDINRIYSDFFEDLKKFKGNSHGFTGLSEYLVFRFLYHLLGGGDLEKAPQGTGLWFVSKSDRNLRIGQSTRVDIGDKKYFPDIAVLYKSKLVAVAQIKTYLVNGSGEIEKEMDKITALRKQYTEMQAVLIMFQGPAMTGRVYGRLDRLREDNTWFDFLILKDNRSVMENELRKIVPRRFTKTKTPNKAAQCDAEDRARYRNR